MKWTDTQRIAEELYDLHGDNIDPKTVRFTQLRDLIMALPDFDDDPAALRRAHPRSRATGLDRRSRVNSQPMFQFR